MTPEDFVSRVSRFLGLAPTEVLGTASGRDLAPDFVEFTRPLQGDLEALVHNFLNRSNTQRAVEEITAAEDARILSDIAANVTSPPFTPEGVQEAWRVIESASSQRSRVLMSRDAYDDIVAFGRHDADPSTSTATTPGAYEGPRDSFWERLLSDNN